MTSAGGVHNKAIGGTTSASPSTKIAKFGGEAMPMTARRNSLNQGIPPAGPSFHGGALLTSPSLMGGGGMGSGGIAMVDIDGLSRQSSASAQGQGLGPGHTLSYQALDRIDEVAENMTNTNTNNQNHMNTLALSTYNGMVDQANNSSSAMGLMKPTGMLSRATVGLGKFIQKTTHPKQPIFLSPLLL